MNGSNSELERAKILVAGKDVSWLGRWLQPTGPQVIILSLTVFTLIVMVCLLVYETGGTSYAWLHLMYLPIILAGVGLRIYGGVAAALLAGIAIGPFMPMDVAEGLPQTPSNWLFRVGFFLLAGVFCGLISSFLNGQIQRLKETHTSLLAAHEELKSAQMQLIQTAKLESIGRLAAGVAHEVKNPLAIIQLGLDYLGRARKPPETREIDETVEEMVDAVQRADAVIKGLLNFSRSEPLTLAPMDLNTVIEESVLLVKHELTKSNITLELNLSKGLPKMELDAGKFKQVLINVFMNAIQAMGKNGKLWVSTLITWDSAEEGRKPAGNPSVWIRVEDSGPGIPEDKLDRLFEPFFTTKAVGTGTGLGLSVSRNIIELHRGIIKIANREQVPGVAVTIRLPVPDLN